MRLTVVFKTEMSDAAAPTLSSAPLYRLLDTTETMAHVVTILLLGLMTSVKPLWQDPTPQDVSSPPLDLLGEGHSSERMRQPYHGQEEDALNRERLAALAIPQTTVTPMDNTESERNDRRLLIPPIPTTATVSARTASGSSPASDFNNPKQSRMLMKFDTTTSIAALSSNEDQDTCDIKPGEAPRVHAPGKLMENIDRLAIIHGHARALLLHDYMPFMNPLPRLFIVLSSAASRIDLTSWFTPKFRLYFLCECSNHVDPTVINTLPSPSDFPRHVHLAKHEGYELLRPKEFFATYGKHVLTVLEMVKHGITTTSAEVPPMITLKLLDGADDIQYRDITKENICGKLDHTIEYLKHQLNEVTMPENALEWMPLDIEDLNNVRNFIRDDSQGPALGNLYRTITAQNEVRWICLDHYRDANRFLVTESLPETGCGRLEHVDNQLGKVSVLLSREEAIPFYSALRKTPTVFDLSVTFSMNATEADFRELCDAIRRSDVVMLSISDTALDSTFRGSKRSGRLAPIVELLASGRIQAFHVKGSELLDTVLSEVTMGIQGLYELQLGIGSISPDVERQFASLVQCFPHLTHLSLYCEDMDKAFELFLASIEDLQFLSTLTLSTTFAKSVLHRETMIWEWTCIDCNLEDVLRYDDNSMSIILPFAEDSLAPNVAWFDALYDKRQSPLTVTFVGSRHETIVEIEFRHPESNDGRQVVGQHLQGLQSTMYMRWRDHGIRNSGWQSSTPDAVTLDFQAMKNQGIRRILQSVDMLEPSELQMVLCKLEESVMQLVVSGIRPTSWTKLTRLDLRGRGRDLDSWIGCFGSCFPREAMPLLRVLCLIGTTSTLSDESVKWIETVLWRDNTELRPVDTITLESIDLRDSQWDNILAAIELSEVKFLSFAGSTIGLEHINALLGLLPKGTGLTRLVLNGISWLKDLKDNSLKELEQELVEKSVGARIHFE